ncbi:MAG: hypothetical protein V4772_22340 [Pseudomonadota bacterium]
MPYVTWCAALLLGGCSLLPEAKRNIESPSLQIAKASVPTAEPRPVPAIVAPVPAPVAATAPVANDLTLQVLAYADRIRPMQPAELNLEVARLGEGKTPVEQLELSLALSQLRQLPELLRAQELLARVQGNRDAAALHPLARLLVSRYLEQRRLEEQLERQAQQLRDTQRRLEQTNDRLEALKAIERSLVSRPAASASTPGTSTSTTSPATPANRRTRPAP